MGLLSSQPESQSQHKSKYRNKRTLYNGRLFASKKEAERAIELDLLVRSGIVKEWEAQPRFPMEHNGVKICSYVGDFRVIYPDGRIEIEDVKGMKTPMYNLKKKLVRAFYGIDIKEI